MSTRERRDRSDKADRELSLLFLEACEKHKISTGEIALAAVGGYGRGELAPGSDLDITIIHRLKDRKLDEFISDFLYPLWSAGRAVDHSVRTIQELLEVGRNDVRVVLGALDIRHIVGNSDITNDASEKVLKLWQSNTGKFIPEIRKSIEERTARSGELAYLLEPDLKEARGGLRDINILRAIAKLGTFTVPLERISEAEYLLQNIRESLHLVTTKPREQLMLTEQDKVAEELNYADADELMLEIAKAARTVDYVSDSVWHAIEHKPRRFKFKKGVKLAAGIISENNEICFEEGFLLTNNPEVAFRAAALAAQQGLPLAPDAVKKISENFQPLKSPWSRQAREDLIAIIGAGGPMIRVIEALDQENLISKWIPEWEHVRFLPQRNVLHRHTVDRHMLETAVEASKLTRTVRRPDLLLFASLFHDIGKGFPEKDHSEYGAELMSKLAKRVGFSKIDCETLEFLVREHLTISTAATRRDLDDPQTIADVVSKVGDHEKLHLLHALSIADGKATGKTAWSEWKAKLIADLVSRCSSAMLGEEPVSQPDLQLPAGFNQSIKVSVEENESGFELEIISRDQVGLLTAIAGVLSINRFDLRNAKTKTIGDYAIGKWIVTPDVNAEPPSATKLTDQISKAIRGELDLEHQIDQRIDYYRKLPGILTPDPIVFASNDLASNATVLEVRMHDRPGILYSVAKSISRYGFDIKAIVVSTLGAEAFDTIYITTTSGEPLKEDRAKLLANQVESALITYR
jgi:[protein-PII] uridylyltransferase